MGALFEKPLFLVLGLAVLILIGVVFGVVWGAMRKTPKPRAVGPDGKKVDMPAGWYPNPTGPGQRYWTGEDWTDQYAP